MNEDWRAGDLAVCIVDTFFPGTVHDPRRDQLLRVTGLTESIAFGSNCLIYGLSFEGRPSHIFWQSQCFRKIRPAHDAADDEFCAEMRRRVKGRVGAESSLRNPQSQEENVYAKTTRAQEIRRDRAGNDPAGGAALGQGAVAQPSGSGNCGATPKRLRFFREGAPA